MQIANLFTITSDTQINTLRQRLRAMEREGQLLFTRNKTYALANKLNLIRGIVSAKRDGIGFLLPFDNSGDLFLSNSQMSKVFDGDEVLVQEVSTKHQKKREANIVEILNRAHPELIGRCVLENNILMLIAQSTKIQHKILLTPNNNYLNIVDKIVKVKITKWPALRTPAIGEIIDVLGELNKPGIACEIAIYNYGLPNNFSDDVLTQAQNITNITEQDLTNRLDLTSLPFVTIDGETAKDFDDAVFARKNRRGFELYVAIADVAHYVKPNSAIDLEAAKRGNSVYFPHLVLPMLPENLSNNLCSLMPNTARLVLVCIMQISPNGNLLEYKFAKAVINSCARLTYTQVAAYLDNNSYDLPNKSLIANSLTALSNLYDALIKARGKRGSLDFTINEVQFILNDQLTVANIEPIKRNIAHRLIEECMLIANVAAANLLQKLQVPSLYRVHPEPNLEKIENLKSYLSGLGLQLIKKVKNKSQVPTPKDYQILLDEIKDRADANIIQIVLLRSLNQAIYDTKAGEHFGLNFELYTHFTSPIRRYPDLLVHRAISSLICNNKINSEHIIPYSDKSKHYPYTMEQLSQFGVSCSHTERRADEATRDVNDWLKCEYMSHKVGDVFSGIINAVVSFGIFVELQDILIEGLVHISALPSDYYIFDNKTHRLVGEQTGLVFKLGDKVQIQVARVDLNERNIDFVLVSAHSKPAKNSKRKRKKI